jgi:hypothetical protein
MLGKAGDAEVCAGHLVLASASKAADAEMPAGRAHPAGPRGKQPGTYL